MTMIRHPLVFAAVTFAVATGCQSDNASSEEGGPPESPLPTEVTLAAQGGFQQPGDAVPSHDGREIFFFAYQEGAGESSPAILRVPSTGGSVAVVHAGAPLGVPSGLVLSCDGATLYIADRRPEQSEPSSAAPERGALFALDVQSGALSRIPSEGVELPAGLALSVDCTTLYVSGLDRADVPSLFRLPVEGGLAQTVFAGAPLVSPTGIHVDENGVVWTLDHLALGSQGPGVLFSIDERGQANEVLSNLRLGTPGGVSLGSIGLSAFIPTLDERGRGQITVIRLEDAQVTNIPTPALTDPAGIRTARNAPVFAVVDGESAAIYSVR